MAAVDFEAWALEELTLTLRGRTYQVPPPSVDAGGKILAAAARGEVVLGIEQGPIPEELQRVLDSIQPGEHPALSERVYQQMVDDGVSQVELDRMSYYAVFYWARGKAYADRLAALLWAPREAPAEEQVDAAPKG